MENLVIATGNKKKFREIKKILKDVPVKLNSLLDFPKRPHIVEDGNTFFENAGKKAEQASLFYNCWALGEDSGLEVSFLDGSPGIFSARYAGKDATDRQNIEKLLRSLEGVPKSKRHARFFCCAVLALRGKLIGKFEGTLQGLIQFKAKGTSGFGYDPVFFVPRFGKTLAQIPLSVKNTISHRYKALSKFKTYFRNYLNKHEYF